MNERFLELAKQTEMTRILDEYASEYGNGMFENTSYLELEKFAELIVKTCVDIVDNTELGYRDYRNQIEEGMRDDCANNLRHYFGLELKHAGVD